MRDGSGGENTRFLILCSCFATFPLPDSVYLIYLFACISRVPLAASAKACLVSEEGRGRRRRRRQTMPVAAEKVIMVVVWNSEFVLFGC